MLNKFKAFLKSEKGAETLEYIAIATIVIVVGAGAYKAAGIAGMISGGFNAISTAMQPPAG